MRKLRSKPQRFCNAQHIFTSTLKVNVLAGERPPLLYSALLCGVASRPEIDRLTANQQIRFTFPIPLRKDVAELFEGKAHRWRLRDPPGPTEPSLASSGAGS